MSASPGPQEVYANLNLPIMQLAMSEGCRNLMIS